MSSEPEQTTIRWQDVEAVADKLESFKRTLPDQEKEVLGWLLARAQAAGDLDMPVRDVTQPISSSLAQAAGLRPQAAKSEVSVTWKHSFAA